MKTLIICEKPSQAEAVTNAVAAETKKREGYYENDSYIVCNAVGHLMTIDDTKLSEKWTTTPYLFDPTKNPIYNYKIDSKTKKQYDLIESLLKRNDISEIINACDPDAEGEAIYRTIIEYATLKNPSIVNKTQKRLIIKSLTPDGISTQMDNLEPIENYDGLKRRAYARSLTDFTYGINLTRTTTVTRGVKSILGRVQTPTLRLIVDRYKDNKNFNSKKDYSVVLKINETEFKCKELRFTTKELAENYIKDLNLNIEINTTYNKKESNPTKLHDLASIQKWANKNLKLSASDTLKTVQKLYDAKLITYPRTDCRNITLKQAELLNKKYNRIETLKCVGQTTAHEALTTTESSKPTDLTDIENNIYTEIEKTVLANFESKAKALVVDSVILVGEHNFKYSESVITEPGYLEVYNDSPFKNAVDELTFEKGITNNTCETKIVELISKPKPLFTEATLISKMQNLGRDEADEKIKLIYKDIEGIGTPATRAGIINNLKVLKYITVEKNNLVPTKEGISLIEELVKVNSPLVNLKFTAELETKLKKLEKFDTFSDFIKNLNLDVTKINEELKSQLTNVSSNTKKESLGICPKCNQDTISLIKTKTHTFYPCMDRECSYIVPNWYGVIFTENEVKNLLKGKPTNKHELTSKAGKKYSAKFVLSKDISKLEFHKGK